MMLQILTVEVPEMHSKQVAELVLRNAPHQQFYLRPKVVLSYSKRVLSNPSTARSYWKGLVGFANSVAGA